MTMSETASAREALIQQLQADQWFGIREIPLRLPQRGIGKSTATPAPAAGFDQPPHEAPAPISTPARVSAEELAQRAERLRVIDTTRVKPCIKCALSGTRTQTVFGQGNAGARVMFVGEAPGYEEDKQGLAFVGPAGQLLTKMIIAMGLARSDVYICNVIKCRPPDNRTPATDEIAACSPYLYEQISIIRPEILVALGAPAAKTLLQTGEAIGRLRGRFHDFHPSGFPGAGAPIPLMPTYHPAYLLRTPGDKAKTWADLQQVMQRLGLPLPPKR
jgi:DNA polymerase